VKRHPVQKIIEHYLRNGKQPPVFREIGGSPEKPNGMSWWVKTDDLWSHVIFHGKRQFVDGRLL